jgi:hypothetical protein
VKYWDIIGNGFLFFCEDLRRDTKLSGIDLTGAGFPILFEEIGSFQGFDIIEALGLFLSVVFITTGLCESCLVQILSEERYRAIRVFLELIVSEDLIGVDIVLALFGDVDIFFDFGLFIGLERIDIGILFSLVDDLTPPFSDIDRLFTLEFEFDELFHAVVDVSDFCMIIIEKSIALDKIESSHLEDLIDRILVSLKRVWTQITIRSETPLEAMYDTNLLTISLGDGHTECPESIIVIHEREGILRLSRSWNKRCIFGIFGSIICCCDLLEYSGDLRITRSLGLLEYAIYIYSPDLIEWGEIWLLSCAAQVLDRCACGSDDTSHRDLSILRMDIGIGNLERSESRSIGPYDEEVIIELEFDVGLARTSESDTISPLLSAIILESLQSFTIAIDESEHSARKSETRKVFLDLEELAIKTHLHNMGLITDRHSYLSELSLDKRKIDGCDRLNLLWIIESVEDPRIDERIEQKTYQENNDTW